MVLDGVEDPHNLGAIVRTAHAAGAAAIVIPERRAAGLTETVARTSAGAVAYLPVVRVTNISRALEELKERGYWIYGLDERGDQATIASNSTHRPRSFWGARDGGCTRPWRGIAMPWFRFPWRRVLRAESPRLNVSVAAGVVLFEWRRRQTSLT